MPQPVSLIRSRTRRSVRRPPSSHGASAEIAMLVSMVNWPPSGMASRELAARFMTISSISCGSTRMRHTFGSSLLLITMCSPISGRSRACMLVRRWFRLTSFGFSTLRRLNASSCLVSVLARFVALRICSSRSRRGSASPVWSSSIWECPPMMVSRLLKSCATPPASLPTASILCAWELLFQFAARGDILGNTRNPIRPSLGVVDGKAAVLDPSDGAVRPNDPIRLLRRCRARLGDEGSELFAVVLVDALHQPSTHLIQRSRIMAPHLFKGRADVQWLLPVDVEHPENLVDVLRQLPETLFA